MTSFAVGYIPPKEELVIMRHTEILTRLERIEKAVISNSFESDQRAWIKEIINTKTEYEYYKRMHIGTENLKTKLEGLILQGELSGFKKVY